MCPLSSLSSLAPHVTSKGILSPGDFWWWLSLVAAATGAAAGAAAMRVVMCHVSAADDSVRVGDWGIVPVVYVAFPLHMWVRVACVSMSWWCCWCFLFGSSSTRRSSSLVPPSVVCV